MCARMSEFANNAVNPEALLERWLTGDHSLMRKLRESVRLHAQGLLSVLIEGEPGTGKERVARALHELSGRYREPFVAINLAAISAQLLESELFGHEKGAFTGANERRIGHFERAAGGIVFLDEVGDAPPQSQIRMLRAMDPGEFTRVGGHETILMKARILAATNAKPEASLRADFLDRVAGIRLLVPPLRERLSDLPILSRSLLEEHARKTGSSARSVSDEALGILSRHRWPDNVRGLKRVLWQCASWVRGPEIAVSDVERAMEGLGQRVLLGSISELHRFQQVLREERGIVTRAAERLGLGRTQFYQRLKDLGLDPRAFRGKTEHVRSEVFSPNTPEEPL